MYKKGFYFAAIVVFLFCSSCRNQAESHTTAAKGGADEALDSFFQTLAEKEMFNGAVAVKKEGKLILKKGYGKANFKYDEDFTPETPMEIASVSKQFTAAAILILQQEGKLHIEDRAKKYLGADFPYPKITIKHLLTHTSGLPNYATYFRKEWDTTKIAYNKDILTYFKTEKPELISVPGERYKYSNSGYIVLAEIVAAVSGRPLDEFLRNQIFQPAEMGSSAFYERDTIWQMKGYAPGYMLDLRTCDYVRPEDLPGKYYYYFLSGRLGSGRLSSSVDDLIKWDRILYTDEILNQKSKEEAFAIHQPQKDTSDYGFGWHIYKDSQLGKVVYHTGSWAGNLSFIKRFLDDKSLIIILNNTHSPYMKEIRTDVENYLKGEPLKIPKQKLEYALQKKICGLDKETVISWYKDRVGEVVVDPEALQKLKKEYRETGADEKAETVEKLLTFIKASKSD